MNTSTHTPAFRIVVSGTREGWKGGEILSLLTQVRNYLTGEPRTLFDDDNRPYEVYPYGELVHGAAKGVDQQAAHIWSRNWMGTTRSFLADWQRFGKSAGHKRNAQMAEYALEGFFNKVPTAVVSFQGWNSKGTLGVQRTEYFDRIITHGVPFFWVKSEEWRGTLHATDSQGTINVQV